MRTIQKRGLCAKIGKIFLRCWSRPTRTNLIEVGGCNLNRRASACVPAPPMRPPPPARVCRRLPACVPRLCPGVRGLGPCHGHRATGAVRDGARPVQHSHRAGLRLRLCRAVCRCAHCHRAAASLRAVVPCATAGVAAAADCASCQAATRAAGGPGPGPPAGRSTWQVQVRAAAPAVTVPCHGPGHGYAQRCHRDRHALPLQGLNHRGGPVIITAGARRRLTTSS